VDVRGRRDAARLRTNLDEADLFEVGEQRDAEVALAASRSGADRAGTSTTRRLRRASAADPLAVAYLDHGIGA
jgi:hypothetical protein